MQSLGWNRVAFISSRHPHFVDSTRTFFRSAKEQDIQIVTHNNYYNIETFLSLTEYLQELQRFGIKIVVAFVSQLEAVDILCTA